MDTVSKRHLYKLRWKRENRRKHGDVVRHKERVAYAKIPLRTRQERARLHNLKTRTLKTRWQRKNFRQYQYGLSLDQFQGLIQKQNGLCAICHTKPREVLFVDHHHTTGKVRGLLCRRCNYAMAALDACPQWLHLASQYVHTCSFGSSSLG